MATNSFPDDRRQGPRVGVIGSARLSEESPAWKVGEELGRLLAVAGCTVVTGGYGGLMGAVSKGAANADGHVIGLPIRSWTHLVPNQWNSELEWADGYPARLASFLRCQGVVALDGGVGTLSELAVMWAASQTEPAPIRLAAIGERWRRLLDAIGDQLVIDSRDLALIQVVDSPMAAVDAMLRHDSGGASPRAFG